MSMQSGFNNWHPKGLYCLQIGLKQSVNEFFYFEYFSQCLVLPVCHIFKDFLNSCLHVQFLHIPVVIKKSNCSCSSQTMQSKSGFFLPSFQGVIEWFLGMHIRTTIQVKELNCTPISHVWFAQSYRCDNL